jgi:hypothetical protein
MSMNTIFSAADTSDRGGNNLSDYDEIDDELSDAYEYVDLSEEEDGGHSEAELEDTMCKEPLRGCKRNSMGEIETESDDDSSSRSSLQLFEIEDSKSVAKTVVTETPAVRSTAMILQLQRHFFQRGVKRPEGSLFIGDNSLSASMAKSGGVARVISTEEVNSKDRNCEDHLVQDKKKSQALDKRKKQSQRESYDNESETASYHWRLSVETKEEDTALFANYIDSALIRARDTENSLSDSTSASSSGSPDLKEDKFIIATSFKDADKKWSEYTLMASHADLKDAQGLLTSVATTESLDELDNSYRRSKLNDSFRKDLAGIRQMIIEVGDAADIKAAASRTSKSKDVSSRQRTCKRTSSASYSRTSYERSQYSDVKSIKKGRSPSQSLISLQESVELPMIDEWIDSIFISLYPSSEALEFSSLSIETDTEKTYFFNPNLTKQRLYKHLKNLRHDINDLGLFPKGMRGYSGNHNKIGQRNGFGVYRSSSGNEYKGEWLDGRKHGFGIARYADSGIYYGQWSHNYREGHGVMQIANGDVFEGDWSQHKKNGIGVYYYA